MHDFNPERAGSVEIYYLYKNDELRDELSSPPLLYKKMTREEFDRACGQGATKKANKIIAELKSHRDAKNQQTPPNKKDGVYK